MGLGGWMVQEGYMMAPGGFSSTQYQIKDKLKNYWPSRNGNLL